MHRVYSARVQDVRVVKWAVIRYWISETYSTRHASGQEPQNIDKEFLRLWFRANCDPYNDKVIYVLALDKSGYGLLSERCKSMLPPL